jgi:transcriptional regulator GlxA family with amidase domain
LIVREMFRANALAGRLSCPAIDPVVQMMLQEMDQLVSRRVQLADLAARSGYSAQHLNRIFRKGVGITPMKYLLQRRLERAAQMLEQDILTISAIARSLTINDMAYFSRLFRRRYGVGPAEYRRIQRSEYPT